MTLDEARRKAHRMVAITGQPAVVFRCPFEGWDAWHSIEAAKWLAEDGELVIPDPLRDPDEVERQLREQAQRLQGPARLTLLEAAMFVRVQGARSRVARAG
jgi:hypothetical protein